jgi:hypothetical protein
MIDRVCPLAKKLVKQQLVVRAFNQSLCSLFSCFALEKEVLIVPMETLWVIEPSLQAMTILGAQQLKYS